MSPQQVSMTATAASRPDVRTVVVNTTAQVAFEAAVRYTGPNGGWLSVTPLSGTAPATLTVTADPAGLAPGTYTAQITVAAGPLRVGAWADIRFTVTGSDVSAGSGLIASPTSLSFFSESPGPQAISLTSATGGQVPFKATANSSGNWLLVASNSETTPANLIVSAVQIGFRPGVYSGAVNITTGTGQMVIPVVLVISGTEAAPESLLLTQSAITANYRINGDIPPIQQIGAVSTIGGAREFSVSSSASWLRLASTNNSLATYNIIDLTPSIIALVFSPSGLAVGTYTATVTINSSGFATITVPVTLTVATTPTLNANPSSVVFDDSLGIGLSSITTISSTSTTSGLLFTATVTSLSPWLSVTPNLASTGSNPTLSITANPETVAEAGTYKGTVLLVVQGSGATLSIPVTFKTKGRSSVDTLSVSSTAMELSAIAGGPNPSQTATVAASRSTGTHQILVSATSSGGWLSATPYSTTAPGVVTVTANAAAVPPGVYNGSVRITSLATGQVETISVVFRLSALGLAADPAQISFTQQPREAAPASQTVRITSNVSSLFSVSAQPAWVRVVQSSPWTPSSLTVSVVTAGLSPGTYTGAIQLTGAASLSIPVSLTIAAPPAPTAAPGSVTLTYEIGRATPAAQTLSIGSTGAPVRFKASATTESGLNWLTVTPDSGSTPTVVSATVDPALLVPGEHTAVITLTAEDPAVSPRTVPVTVTVSASPVAVREVLNAASRTPTPVAAGQLITITGAGIGPANGISARPTAAGAVDTALGDVRVTFDGVPAPLLYVRTDQINAIVPYAVYGRTNTRLQVQVGPSYSVPIDLKVVEIAPALFTTDSSGRGQAAALNSDNTVNSLQSPARRGGVIVLYGTGEGQTDPAGQDGRIISTDLRRPLLPFTATIGGKPAEVLYAGSASGLVSGAFQANVRIPESVDAGAALIEIQIGGVATQSGVTVMLR
jgi:trimeric autotransporter adhesin